MEKEKSPAEILASKRPIKRAARNTKPYTRKTTWKCRLREIRVELRLSMDEVVKALGISKTAYWQIEKGGDPMLTTAVKISRFFGTKIDFIWPELIVETK